MGVILEDRMEDKMPTKFIGNRPYMYMSALFKLYSTMLDVDGLTKKDVYDIVSEMARRNRYSYKVITTLDGVNMYSKDAVYQWLSTSRDLLREIAQNLVNLRKKTQDHKIEYERKTGSTKQITRSRYTTDDDENTPPKPSVQFHYPSFSGDRNMEDMKKASDELLRKDEVFYDNTDESTSTNSYSRWYNIFVHEMNEAIQNIRKSFLDNLGITLNIDNGYVPDNDDDWLAIYRRSEGKIAENEILVYVNYARIYEEMCNRGIEDDTAEIGAQARITVGHEIGHGLVDYMDYHGYLGNVNLSEEAEEALVEEFGESLYPEVTGVWESKLATMLKDIVELEKEQE